MIIKMNHYKCNKIVNMFLNKKQMLIIKDCLGMLWDLQLGEILGNVVKGA